MSEHDSFMIHYAEGRGFNLGKAVNKVAGWADFCKMLSKPTKTKERRKIFDKLTKEEQDNLKAIDGWIIGAQVAHGQRTKRNIKPRDLLSLDYDYATPAFIDQIGFGLTPLSDFEFFVHTSRRHTEDKPRLRLFAPLARPVSADEYIALSRIVAMTMEGKSPMTMVDKVSFRVAQMMFKPTISVDGDWFSHRNTGSLIDPDAILDAFGDWHDISQLPLVAEEEGDGLRQHAVKAEDPTNKKGPVGDFCRAYDVQTAISKFLPDCYEPVDDYSAKPRYTYLKGTSTSGAVVEDDGLFLYSHHGSDPTADQLVNAFDLVRIHLFHELDADTDLKDTPLTKWPSYKRMLEFILDDPEYRQSQAESRYDISAMFDDVADDDEDDDRPEPPPAAAAPKKAKPNGHAEIDDDIRLLLGFDDIKPASGTPDRGAGSPVDVAHSRPVVVRPKRQPPKDWFPGDLELDQNGRIMSTMPNAAVIVHNDPRLFDGIAFNDFSKQIVARRSLISKLDIAPPFHCRDTTNGDRWQDFNDITIRMILEAPNGEGKRGYGMSMTDRNVNGAVVSTAHRNKFHPVREYLEATPWDGVTRIDTLLSRFLGCPDTPYHREAARMMLVASVARIYEPGHKFDFAIILQGETGIRKSAFVKVLYGDDWFGELSCKLDDQQAVAEAVGGKWVLELPELSGLHKSDHNAAKAFMRKQFDDVRMAYDRRVSEFPRQCVFWGTTNDTKYLKDPTGNRSYWPVLVTVGTIDTDAVLAEREQLWAEALAAYREMRAAHPRGDLPLYLRSREAQNEAKAAQESARSEELHEMFAEKIADWLDEPITLRQFRTDLGLAADERFDDHSTSEVLVLRCAFTREQAVELALKKDRGIGDYQTAQNIERALPLIPGWEQMRDAARGQHGGQRVRVMGVQKRWWFRSDATLDEMKEGYRIVLSASAGESDYEDLI